MEYENDFMPKPVLWQEYRTLFEYQVFFIQWLHRMHLFITL